MTVTLRAEARYPRAQWLGRAGRGQGLGWGPLPDPARARELNQTATLDLVRAILHTIEGQNLPGYRDGRDAPHFTYLPTYARGNRWYQDARLDRRVGTMQSSRTTKTVANEISVQIEIGAYSDRDLADRRGHLWVGDFTDEHYADLAHFVAWLRDETGMLLDRAYGPGEDFDSFVWGVGDIREMTRSEWLNAGQILTAHGAATGQAHWDTGPLDLHRIVRESLGDGQPPAPPTPSTGVPDGLAAIERSAKELLVAIQELRHGSTP